MKLSNFFILLGIILIIYSSYLVYQRYNPWRLSFASIPKIETRSNPTKASIKNIYPVEVTVADLKIKLPIKEAKIDNKKWEAFADAVSYLSSSPIPGQKGNSILYAHNWYNLFGPLTKAKVGQEVVIRFSDNSKKVFKIKYIQEVNPDQTAILDPSLDTRITLYTCSGFLDSKRFVVVATAL